MFDADCSIIPSNDEFLAEYPLDESRYLKKLTGFSGSNGIAIFSGDKRYFFTDARYLIQAKHELNGDWLIDNISNYWDFISSLMDNVGIFYQLHSAKWVLKMKEIVNIEPLNFNLIKHQTSCNADIFDYDIGSSIEGKIIKIRNFIKSKSADGILITNPAVVSWLLNIRAWHEANTPIVHGYCFVDSERVVLYTEASLEKNLSDIKEIKNKKILLNFSDTNYFVYDILNKTNTVIEYANEINLLKAIKDDEEVMGMRGANVADSKIIIRLFDWIENSKNINESDVSNKLDSLRTENKQYVCRSFNTIVGCEENSAVIHYNCSKNKTLGGLLLIDCGAHYASGTTDITRTVWIGDCDPSEKIIYHYTIVLKSHIAVASAIFPCGTTGAEIDIISRKELWQYGLNCPHGIGHGIGCFLSVHDDGYGISKSCKDPLQENMIMSNEPGVYFENKYGIRLENAILIQRHDEFKDHLCFETISYVPFDEKLIDFSMLNKKEISWLEGYNKKCSLL